MDINLNKPKTIVFHPGIGKTATSAIQKVGLSLPCDDPEQPCFSPYGIFGGAHNRFASNHPNYDPQIFETEWKKLIEFASARNASTIVSSEFLIRDKAEHIKRMIDDCKEAGIDVKVLVAVRNYTDYLVSAFLQAVKVNWGIKPEEDIYSFCQREIELIRVNVLIDKWSRVLSDQDVFVLDYDKYKDKFLELFFSVNQFNIENKTETNERVNKSIPIAAAHMIRHFDRVSSDLSQRADFIKYVSSLSYNENHESFVKKQLNEKIIRNTYNHDIERLSDRYTWVDFNE